MDTRWYEGFFQGIALDFWRKAVPPEQTRREADFLERALRLRPGRGCSTSRAGQGGTPSSWPQGATG